MIITQVPNPETAMMRCISMITLLLLAGSLASAQEKAATTQDRAGIAQEKAAARDAASFLDEAYALYDLPIRNGLESFEAEITVLESRDKAIDRIGDRIVLDYYWETGGVEEIETELTRLKQALPPNP